MALCIARTLFITMLILTAVRSICCFQTFQDGDTVKRGMLHYRACKTMGVYWTESHKTHQKQSEKCIIGTYFNPISI